MGERSAAAASGLAFAAFLAVLVAIEASGAVRAADLQAALWVNHIPLGGFLGTLVVGAGVYGREYFWIPVVALMFLFGDRRTKLVAIGLCGVFVAGIAVGEAAKQLVARERPFQYLAHISSWQGTLPVQRTLFDTDYSFPSGHALIVSIGAVFSLVTFRKKWVALLLTLEAGVVCFSRVYTFEHFPTDVLAGICLGTAIALAGVLVERKFLRGQGEKLAGVLVRLLRDGPLKL